MKAVVIGLVLASIVSWSVWIDKIIKLFLAKRRVARALVLLTKARDIAEAAKDERGKNGALDEEALALVRRAQPFPPPPPEWPGERVDLTAPIRFNLK